MLTGADAILVASGGGRGAFMLFKVSNGVSGGGRTGEGGGWGWNSADGRGGRVKLCEK